jgi:hypothetical protein
VWGYTPRQMVAYLTLAQSRKKQDSVSSLFIHAMAARGEPKEVKRIVEEWQQ